MIPYIICFNGLISETTLVNYMYLLIFVYLFEYLSKNCIKKTNQREILFLKGKYFFQKNRMILQNESTFVPFNIESQYLFMDKNIKTMYLELSNDFLIIEMRVDIYFSINNLDLFKNNFFEVWNLDFICDTTKIALTKKFETCTSLKNMNYELIDILNHKNIFINNGVFVDKIKLFPSKVNICLENNIDQSNHKICFDKIDILLSKKY